LLLLLLLLQAFAVVHASSPLSPGVSPAVSAPGASPSQSATAAAAAAAPATAAVGTGATDPSHAQRVILYVLSQLESLAVHTVCRRPPLHPPAAAVPDSTSAHHLLRRASSAVPQHGSTSSSTSGVNGSAGGAAAGGNGSSSGSGSGMSGAISSGSLFTLEEGVVGTEAGTQYPKVQRYHCRYMLGSTDADYACCTTKAACVVVEQSYICGTHTPQFIGWPTQHRKSIRMKPHLSD
jgi:hypothetical protein